MPVEHWLLRILRWLCVAGIAAAGLVGYPLAAVFYGCMGLVTDLALMWFEPEETQ